MYFLDIFYLCLDLRLILSLTSLHIRIAWEALKILDAWLIYLDAEILFFLKLL